MLENIECYKKNPNMKNNLGETPLHLAAGLFTRSKHAHGFKQYEYMQFYQLASENN